MKYRVTLTSTYIKTITKIVEATNKFEANSYVSTHIKNNEWKIEDKLISNIKKLS